MTVGLAAAIVNGWLDTDFATNWIKLHIGDPGAAGANNAAAGDTSRQQANMGSAAGGSKAMTSMGGNWTNVSTSETLSHVSVWTASTAGTFKASGALTSSQAWADTNTFSLTTFSVAITPIAA